jgi:hypothetical protein
MKTRKQKTYLILGISILLILLLTLFIKIQAPSGPGENTITPILAILIFRSPIMLGIYILIALFLIWKGLAKKIKVV